MYTMIPAVIKISINGELIKTINTLSVSLPLIRRIMPSIIANDIIGVSPMTAPTGQIFSLKARYSH
jgi:hypothetical protein